MEDITHADIRMYRMGTGDCFVIKFFAGETELFKIMIDSGVWSGDKGFLMQYINHLADWVDNYVDVLIVTHEHKDHVYGFEAGKERFTNNFKVGEVWFAWTENDKLKMVKEWREKYGQQKKALGLAAQKLQSIFEKDDYKKQFEGTRFGVQAMEARKNFSDVVSGFADLHLSLDDNNLYAGGLKGMEIVKNNIEKDAIKYFSPGDIMEGLEGLPGVKIYVLGPPRLYDAVAKEAGSEGESFMHNKELEKSGAFGVAVSAMDGDLLAKNSLLPFDDTYITTGDEQGLYHSSDWRKIDYDWLYSAGSFALRMNGLTNNLSLALAIEFEKSGRVMLFPGDAEFGSWESWHQVKWGVTGRDKKPLVEDLLNRTVFYKVAHHLSHNGTAQRLGLEMMEHKDLAAMATLDYSVISNGWKSTMPNRAIIKQLLKRTKGRLMILNEDDLYYDFHKKEPLGEKIIEARSAMTTKEKKAFEEDFISEPLFLQYTVKA